MPRGDNLKQPAPPEKRCSETVKDKRSKNVGLQCPNFRTAGSDVCNAHAGIPQKARQRQLEQASFLAPPELEDPAVRAQEYERKLAADRLEAHYAALDEIEEQKAAKASSPPHPLAQSQIDAGWLWTREKCSRNEQGALLDPETRQPFRWVRRTQHELLGFDQALATPRFERESIEHRRPSSRLSHRNREALRGLNPLDRQ